MSDVERFDIVMLWHGHDHATLIEQVSGSGMYVYASEYDALQQRVAELERWYMQAGDRVHELERRYEPGRDPWQPADNAATAPGRRAHADVEKQP